MLSNKWTFSLTSLVVILALAFVVPSAMAAEFTVGLSVGDTVDISSPDGIQAAYSNTMLLRLRLPRVQWCSILLLLLLVMILKQPREQQQHSSS